MTVTPLKSFFLYCFFYNNSNFFAVFHRFYFKKYNTYLDTELMLVIDSKELNQQIQSTEGTYIEKSKEVLSNGQETEGVQYEKTAKQ